MTEKSYASWRIGGGLESNEFSRHGLTGDVGQTCQERLGPRLIKYFFFFCLILVEREQKADDEQSVMSVEHGSRKQWQKAAKSVTAQKQVSQSQLERYSQRYSLESQRNFSRIQVQSGRYHMFKVAEHSFGSL